MVLETEHLQSFRSCLGLPWRCSFSAVMTVNQMSGWLPMSVWTKSSKWVTAHLFIVTFDFCLDFIYLYVEVILLVNVRLVPSTLASTNRTVSSGTGKPDSRRTLENFKLNDRLVCWNYISHHHFLINVFCLLIQFILIYN